VLTEPSRTNVQKGARINQIVEQSTDGQICIVFGQTGRAVRGMRVAEP
jgi:hypothetical protein